MIIQFLTLDEKEQSDLANRGIDFFVSKDLFQGDEDLQNYYQTQLQSLINVEECERKGVIWVKKYVAIGRRILTLIRVTGDIHEDAIRDDVHQFDPIVFPGYDDLNVTFLKHTHTRVQRHQLSGLCYIHAPAVLQFYLSSINLGSRAEMLDIVHFVQTNLSCTDLRKRIVDDEGGSSVSILKSITRSDNILAVALADAPAYFDKYGPALVSVFRVHRDFVSKQKFHYSGSPTGEYEGNHAMVLVGYRTDANNKTVFLLQNWWKEKQFVEVATDYMMACQPIIYFVTAPLQSIDPKFRTNAGQYFESECIDMAESFNPERL